MVPLEEGAGGWASRWPPPSKHSHGTIRVYTLVLELIVDVVAEIEKGMSVKRG